MSPRPSDLLTGLPPQFEMRTEGEKWQGAFKAAQGAVREQGEVMSATLSNNRSLWETNKRLRAELDEARSTAASARGRADMLQRKLDAIPADVQERATLQADNERLKAANAALARQLSASLMPELDTDQLRAELARVKAQEAEIQATGLVPTAEDIARRDHARDQTAPFKLDPAAVK